MVGLDELHKEIELLHRRKMPFVIVDGDAEIAQWTETAKKLSETSKEVFVYFKMKGSYSTLLLAEEYGKLPGVTHSEGNGFGGDGPTICATKGPTTWHYVFDDASGDCPAGCIDHAYRHFTTEPDGAVMDLGSWDSKGGTPRPEWAVQYAASGTCH